MENSVIETGDKKGRCSARVTGRYDDAKLRMVKTAAVIMSAIQDGEGARDKGAQQRTRAHTKKRAATAATLRAAATPAALWVQRATETWIRCTHWILHPHGLLRVWLHPGKLLLSEKTWVHKVLWDGLLGLSAGLRHLNAGHRVVSSGGVVRGDTAHGREWVGRLSRRACIEAGRHGVRRMLLLNVDV